MSCGQARRRRRRSNAWMLKAVSVCISIGCPRSCQAFRSPSLPTTSLQSAFSRHHRQHRHRLYLQKESPTKTDEELKRDIQLIARHPETKRVVSSTTDVISGSINVTKIEYRLPQSADDSTLSSASVSTIDKNTTTSSSITTTLRSLWSRRHARTAEEGIRREKAVQLSNLLARRAGQLEYASSRRYGARTIMGLIHALAEEADDLDVEVDARRDTPLWGKQVDAIRIKFSRLGFKPLRMGGLDQAFHEFKAKFPDTEQGAFHMDRQLYDLSCADEAFERIDVDNSGALDSSEIADALVMAARSSDETEHRKLKATLKDLAKELVALYDFNGDGVVDRSEYQTMVEDMASLKEQQEMDRKVIKSTLRSANESTEKSLPGWIFDSIKSFVLAVVFRTNDQSEEKESDRPSVDLNEEDIETAENASRVLQRNDAAASKAPLSGFDWANGYTSGGASVSEVTNEQLTTLLAKDLGLITISDLKLDLRRLFFGAIPFIKHITPGGPLILEPFTTTITASFNSHDIKNSFLLDAGLKRLVAQAIRRRVRSLRDTIDGAVFYGRSWKMSSMSAPVVEVIAIEDVEFDDVNRLILTGRVRVKTGPEQPMVENAFKLRARLGTNTAGRRIRLVEPELALVLECPSSWESVLRKCCDVLNLSERPKPKPLYFFFPIYSPFKLEDPDNDGFDLGEDNQIKSIYIQDNALRFELSAVLRPGRFLGNHYLAFTIPNRTFIITLDRVKEGIRTARKMKQAAKAVQDASAKIRRQLPKRLRRLQEVKRVQPPKSFFSRFVDGYIRADRGDDSDDRVTRAIRDFFSRQSARRRNSNSGSNSLREGNSEVDINSGDMEASGAERNDVAS